VVDITGLEDLIRRHGLELMDSARLDVEEATIAAAPRLTGELANSVATYPAQLQGDVATFDIEVRADHAEIVIFGSRAHVIVPVRAKMLHWGGAGGVFARRVNHPGTRPNETFLTDQLLADRLAAVVTQ